MPRKRYSTELIVTKLRPATCESAFDGDPSFKLSRVLDGQEDGSRTVSS